MKTYIKFIFVNILFLLTTFSGFSQFTFGPKIGVNFSNVINESSMKPGFDAGVFLRIGRSFYFQPELDYSFRSSTLSGAIDELQENTRLKNHYFDIPLLLGFKFINNPNFNFRVSIGPRLGILLANNIDVSKSDNPVGTVQIGGRTGIGVDVWRFTFDVNYDFSASKYNSASTSTWWKQNMINIAVGFKILKGH